ncbi:MAG: STAS domain-containing protein [Leptospira sp.]|nr:STAS domain-containing protein [Leptospira sp.]
MSSAKELIINLSGNLNAELCSELEEKLRVMEKKPLSLLFDASELTGIEKSGADALKIFRSEMYQSGTRTAFCNLNDDRKAEFNSFDLNLIFRIFPGREEGKLYLKNSGKVSPIETPVTTTVIPKNNPETNSFSVHCPGCFSKLNVSKKGNYACPVCNTKFFIHSNHRISAYEKLN